MAASSFFPVSSAANAPIKLTDSSKAWADDVWIGKAVVIISGPGAGQRRVIIDNDSDDLLLATKWDLLPTSSSTYLIVPAERRTSSVVYDADNNVIEATDGEGQKTTATFDSLNRQRTVTVTANVLASGTATSTGMNTLSHSGQSWPSSQRVGRKVRILSGSGAGQERTIASHTADTSLVQVPVCPRYCPFFMSRVFRTRQPRFRRPR